jgi:hypothetical protein
MRHSGGSGLSLPHSNRLTLYPSWMPDSGRTHRPGPAPRNPIDAFFARVWFFAVKFLSGLPSAYAIDQLHDGTAECVWPKNSKPYELGQRVPDTFIGAVECRFPGTARYFNSALRELLGGKAVTIEWVEARLVSLPKQFTDLLLIPLPDHLADLPVAILLPFDGQRVVQLVQLGGLHALEAAMLLMKLGELNAAPELRRLAREAYIRLQPSVRAEPVLSPFADELFAKIDDAFPLWIFPNPGHRVVVRHPAILDLRGTALNPEDILAGEKSPTGIKAALRCDIELRVLQAQLRRRNAEAESR